MKNYIQAGNTLTLKAGLGQTIHSSHPVTIGAVTTGITGIAMSDAVAGEEYEAMVGGVVWLPKVTTGGSALAVGTIVTLNIATGNVATNAAGTGYHRCGMVWQAAGDSDDKVAVKLYEV